MKKSTIKQTGPSGNVAGKKTADVSTKRGKASNRQGVRYGARLAGGGAEHFEPGGRFGASHTHSSAKMVDERQRSSRKKDKGREQRIVSG